MTKETEQDLIKKLIDQMSNAYNDPAVASSEELKTLLVTSGNALEANGSYGQAVTDLAHGISEYYVHHDEVPDCLLKIFRDIQADVKAGKIDAPTMRKYNLAVGLAMMGVTFH